MAEKQLRPLSVSEPCFSLGKINLYFLKLFRKENAAGHVFPRVFHGSPSSALYKAEGLRARGRECHRQWCPDELHLPRLREVRAQQIQEWETFLGFPYLPAEMDWTWTCTSVYLGGWHSVGLPNLLHMHCAAASTCLGNAKYSENVIKGEGELKVSGISQVASCLGDWHQGAIMQVQDKPHALGVFSCTLGPEYMLNCTCTETVAGHTEIPSK